MQIIIALTWSVNVYLLLGRKYTNSNLQTIFQSRKWSPLLEKCNFDFFQEMTVILFYKRHYLSVNHRKKRSQYKGIQLSPKNVFSPPSTTQGTHQMLGE